MDIFPEKLEVNYNPVTQTTGLSGTPTTGSTTKGMSPDTAPASNTPAVVIPEGNIATIAGGSLLKSGYFQSINYSKGLAGFKIDSDGSVEFGSGYFRGDITGASGTFSGSITVGAGSTIAGFSIGADYIRDNANSFGLASTVSGSNDVRFWAGDTFANRATAPLRLYEDGSIIATNITATGAVYATSGWIGASTALVYESQGINTGTTGWIRGGQTGYNTGTGYFLGYSSGQYKFSIGDGASKALLWDGSSLFIKGNVENTVYLTAGVALTAGQAVVIYTDGKVYSADSLVSTMTTSFLGFCAATTAKDSSAPIVIAGQSSYQSGLTIASSYYINNATHTLDQSQTSQDSNTFIGYDVGGTGYQSFTTGNSVTELTKISLYLKTASATQDVTIKIREGEGLSGTLLATTTASVTSTPGYIDVYMPYPIPVSANTLYSICFYGGSVGDRMSIYYKINTNPYANGKFDGSTTDDVVFRTYYSSSRGVIGTTPGTNSKKVGLAMTATTLLIQNI